jgi:N-acetylmuramoyl-L-alanine amidase
MMLGENTFNKILRPTIWLRIPAIVLSLLNHGALGATCIAKAPEKIAIVLDVGHVARQPGVRCRRLLPCPWGATSARGVPEYDFNIKLAQRIKEELVSAGFRSTYLMVTRVSETSGLYQRAERANKMGADIFLSVHHDSVRDEYLKRWTYEGAGHFFFDGSKGFSLHVSPRNIRYGASLRLARMLADRLMEKGLRFTTVHEQGNPIGARVAYIDSTRGIYRRNGLIVLSETKMPAVLLEAGVIVNRDEELVVSSPDYKSTVAMAVVDAVRKFCLPAEASTYRVVNVAPNFVLDVRSGPNADLSVVGAIPPDGRGVRMVGACSGQWCQIEYRAVRGWVDRRFLANE